MLTDGLRKGSTTVQGSDYTISEMNHAACNINVILRPTLFDIVPLYIFNIVDHILKASFTIKESVWSFRYLGLLESL